MTAFILQAVFISLSGVMAPGPLSAAIVGHSHRSAHAGALGALGHGVVEFPLMALILFGFATWADAPLVGPVVGLAGGLVLLWMGITMVVSVRHGLPVIAPEGTDGSAFRAGVLLTGANPYFLVWWLSVVSVSSSSPALTGCATWPGCGFCPPPYIAQGAPSARASVGSWSPSAGCSC